MVPTKRLIAAVFVGSLLVGLLGTDTISPLMAAGFNGLIAAVVIIDLILTDKKSVFQINRLYEYKMSLGARNPVRIVVRNRGKNPYPIVVKDEPPLTHFRVEGLLQEGVLSPGEQKEFVYHVMPIKRGDYQFGVVNFRYLSRLGLFYRQGRVDDKENKNIKVYPNIIDIRHHALNAQKGYVQETGIKPAVVKGLGTDFEGLREYVPDDEYRRVNWTASARKGKLVSNEYQDERSQNILVVLDSGRMMTADVHQVAKFDLAINAALLLGYVGISKDDKVGLMVFNNRVRHFLPPKKGKGQLQRILASLYNVQPSVVEADYRRACHHIMEQNKKRSLVCIFTDLVDHEASRQLINYISVLTRRHLVVCITLVDSELAQRARILPANSQELYEKAVAEGVLREREQAIALLRNLGVVVINVPPEELSIATVNKYLELKGRGRI